MIQWHIEITEWAPLVKLQRSLEIRFKSGMYSTSRGWLRREHLCFKCQKFS